MIKHAALFGLWVEGEMDNVFQVVIIMSIQGVAFNIETTLPIERSELLR